MAQLPLGTHRLAFDAMDQGPRIERTVKTQAKGRACHVRDETGRICNSGEWKSSPMHGEVESRRPVGGALKRIMDIVIASAALFLLAPVMLMLSLFVRVCVGGPVFFAQERVGHNGRTFFCFKFRTMCLNADEVLERYLSSNASAAVEWRQNRKLMADPRVRPAGKVLRKLSLDELPQLFNVLRGDMSMVGPRPVVPSELDCYGEYARDYVKARPGITGLWQVSGRNRISYTSRVALDRYYARRWSIGVDLAILIRTVPAVLRVGNTA